MIKSAKWEHFPPQRPLPSAKPPPSPKGKAVTSSVGNSDTFPKREGKVLFRRQCRHLPRKGRHFRRVGTLFAVSIPPFRFKNRGGTSCRVDKKMNPTDCRIHFLSVDISTFVYLIYQDNLFDYALFFTKRRTTQAISPAISIPKITDTVTSALLSF